MERGKPRFSTQSVISDYKKHDGSFSRFDFVVDVGDGGVFIETSRPLAVGSQIELRLTMAGMSAPLCVQGIVRWARSDLHHRGQKSGMGIQFHETQDGLGQRFREIEAYECFLANGEHKI